MTVSGSDHLKRRGRRDRGDVFSKGISLPGLDCLPRQIR
jgi:hypothetical protein